MSPCSIIDDVRRTLKTTQPNFPEYGGLQPTVSPFFSRAPFGWISKTPINNAGVFEATKTRDSERPNKLVSAGRGEQDIMLKTRGGNLVEHDSRRADRRRRPVEKCSEELQDGMIMTGGITQQLFRGWKRGHKSISHRLWHNAELRELGGISCAHRGSCWAKLILVKGKKKKTWHHGGTQKLWGFGRAGIMRNRVEAQEWKQISGETGRKMEIKRCGERAWRWVGYGQC